MVAARLLAAGGLGGPLVGVGEFVGGEGAVLVLELGYGGQAGTDSEFLASGGLVSREELVTIRRARRRQRFSRPGRGAGRSIPLCGQPYGNGSTAEDI